MLRHRSRAASVALAVTSTVLTVLIVAGAGEMLVRHRERTRETVPGSMPFLYYEHNRLRVALVRDTDYFGWARINTSGFRGRETSEVKPPGTFRIMAVGSSTTFETAIGDDNRTWPALLERNLGVRTGRQVEVINAGVAGYRVLDNLIRLQTELHSFRPDMILLYEGHNDLFLTLLRAREQPSPTRTPGRVTPKPGWQSWLERRSLLYSKVAIKLRMRGFHARASSSQGNPARSAAEWNEILSRGGDAYGRDLASFIAIARALGIQVVIPQLTHVSGAGASVDSSPAGQRRWEHAVGAPPAVVLRGYAIFDSVARIAADQGGAIYLPTAPFAPKGDSLYADGDPVHFAPRGAEVMAEGLAEALLRLVPTVEAANPAIAGRTIVTAAPSRQLAPPVVQSR